MGKIIAVDGTAASGKGTIAKKLAEHLNYAYLDTGKLYRAVGYNVVRFGGDAEDPDAALDAANSLNYTQLDDDALKSDQAAQAASKVAAMPEVRAALLAFQKNFASNPPVGKDGAILDGRDIGTVVCPYADSKIYMTASVEIRAERRHKELIQRGESSIYARVLEDLKERDQRDSNRAVAPLKPADDAEIIDTSDLSIDEAFEAALNAVLISNS
ncbi:(d)CMP kinase [Curvivirga aplysinae]|uniref:(d)CMP kinase n=1 Tax=Curvivirga aplysinae TaxID=2529852 RepID=UPI0012BB9437|nr:(d)CMP kinase [Curvivirga aplysinae]MTI11376.1 (d)CMP kinase [Curvivirga aplysinae]